jgi:hypothetical protein
MQNKMAKYCFTDVPTPNILIDHQCFISSHTDGKMAHTVSRIGSFKINQLKEPHYRGKLPFMKI